MVVLISVVLVVVMFVVVVVGLGQVPVVALRMPASWRGIHSLVCRLTIVDWCVDCAGVLTWVIDQCGRFVSCRAVRGWPIHHARVGFR